MAKGGAVERGREGRSEREEEEGRRARGRGREEARDGVQGGYGET